MWNSKKKCGIWHIMTMYKWFGKTKTIMKWVNWFNEPLQPCSQTRDYSGYGLSQWDEALLRSTSSDRRITYPEWSLQTVYLALHQQLKSWKNGRHFENIFKCPFSKETKKSQRSFIVEYCFCLIPDVSGWFLLIASPRPKFILEVIVSTDMQVKSLCYTSPCCISKVKSNNIPSSL